MRRLLFLLSVVLAIASCRTVIAPPRTVIHDPSLIAKCFPKPGHQAFRVVHVVTATIRGRSRSFIGITIGDISGDRMRATLLSVEGLVLLDAADDKGRVSIYRGMQPFTAVTFAQGLFRDIRFMFFPEHGVLVRAKAGADGSVLCRWINRGHVFEKNTDSSGETTVLEFDADHNRVRSLVLSPPLVNGFYKHMRMDSSTGPGYSLSMDLLEAEPLDHTDGLFSP